MRRASKGAQGFPTEIRAEADALLKTIPQEQRRGEPAEIAEAIWFAVTGPRYFHGRDLRVDGGLT